MTFEADGDSDKLVFGNRADADSMQSESDTLRKKISQELDKRNSRESALAFEEVEAKPVVETPRPVAKPLIEPAQVKTGKPYYIIAGSFTIASNAERQKSQLERKGYTPLLLPKRGNYYMVSLGSYDTHERATTALRQLRKELQQEMWLMKM